MKRQSTGKQLLLLSGIRLWNQGINLIKTMTISRMFSLTEYSTYTKMILILDFAFAIIVLNLPNCATYFVAKSKNEDERHSFILTYYTLCTFVGLFMGGVLVLLSPKLSIWLNCEYIFDYRWFMGITALFQIIPRATTYILTTQGRSSFAVKLSFFSSILTIIGLYISYKSTNSFTICLVLMLVTEGVMTIIGYVIGTRAVGGISYIINNILKIKSADIVNIYKYIIPVGLSSLMLIVNTRIDKILVSITQPNEFYAIYANASKELPVAALSTAVSSIIIPKLVRVLKTGNKELSISIWKSTLVLVSIISFLLLGGTLTFSKEVMTIIYSSKYVEGVDIFRVYLFLIPFHCIEFSTFLSATAKTRYIFISSLASLVTNVVLDFVAIFTIGVIGLGIATVIATIVMVGFQLFFSAKELGVKVIDLLPFKKLAYIGGLNIVMLLVFKFIQHLVPLETIVSSVGEAVILGIIWSSVYLFILKKVIIANWHSINKGDGIL